MATLAAPPVLPLASPLPDSPKDDAYTNEQWRTLLAIMDTIVPSIRRESQSATCENVGQQTISEERYNAAVANLKNLVKNMPDSESLDQYLDEKPSDSPVFVDLLKRVLIQYTREDARKGLGLVLSALK